MCRQECTRAATTLLVTGEDPGSEDGQRLVRVMKALEQVCSSLSPGVNADEPVCRGSAHAPPSQHPG